MQQSEEVPELGEPPRRLSANSRSPYRYGDLGAGMQDKIQVLGEKLSRDPSLKRKDSACLVAQLQVRLDQESSSARSVTEESDSGDWEDDDELANQTQRSVMAIDEAIGRVRDRISSVSQSQGPQRRLKAQTFVPDQLWTESDDTDTDDEDHLNEAGRRRGLQPPNTKDCGGHNASNGSIDVGVPEFASESDRREGPGIVERSKHCNHAYRTKQDERRRGGQVRDMNQEVTESGEQEDGSFDSTSSLDFNEEGLEIGQPCPTPTPDAVIVSELRSGVAIRDRETSPLALGSTPRPLVRSPSAPQRHVDGGSLSWLSSRSSSNPNSDAGSGRLLPQQLEHMTPIQLKRVAQQFHIPLDRFPHRLDLLQHMRECVFVLSMCTKYSLAVQSNTC